MNSLVAYDEDSVGMSPLLASAAVNYTASTFFPPNSTEGNMEMDDLDGDVLYQVPLGIVVMLSTFYGGISLAAVTGNGLVLWVVSVSRRMRTVTNMFIANLALADIIIGLLAIPFQFQAALLQRWNLWHFMCSFCPFVQVLSVNVSVFTLSAIAVDRYRAVLYPLSARASKRKATIFIVIIWSLSILIALPTELDFRVVERREKNGLTKPFCENAWLSDSMRKYYLLGLVVLQYFLPLIILTGAYVRMATRLWGATAPGNAEDTRDAAILRNKKRVIKMLAVVVLVFALCWLPLQTYNFFQSFIPAINNYQYINIIWFSFHWLAMSNSMYNPFIYAIYNDKFQREFRSRLRCMSICSGNRADSPCSELSDFDRSKVRASYRFHDVRQRNGGAGNGEGHGSSKHHSHHHHHNHSYRCQRLSHNRLNSSTRGKRNCVTAFEEENENQQNRLVGNANHINCYNNVVSPPACRTQSQTPDKIIWKRNGQDFTTECVDVEMDADLQSKLTIL